MCVFLAVTNNVERSLLDEVEQQESFMLGNGSRVTDGFNCGAVVYAIAHILMTEGRLPLAAQAGRGADLRLSTVADGWCVVCDCV